MVPALHPRLADPDELVALRERWWTTRRLRIESALAPGFAEALHAYAMSRRFEFYEKHDGNAFVYWRQREAYPADPADSPTIARAQQLVMVEIPALMARICEVPRRPPDWDELTFNLLRKGSYLDPHSDHLPQRVAGFVVGLTKDAWPAERGGWLEFLQPDRHTVIERWQPGFDTLDLLGFYPVMCWHHIPVLQDAVDRLTINGWLSDGPP